MPRTPKRPCSTSKHARAHRARLPQNKRAAQAAFFRTPRKIVHNKAEACYDGAGAGAGLTSGAWGSAPERGGARGVEHTAKLVGKCSAWNIFPQAILIVPHHDLSRCTQSARCARCSRKLGAIRLSAPSASGIMRGKIVGKYNVPCGTIEVHSASLSHKSAQFIRFTPRKSAQLPSSAAAMFHMEHFWWEKARFSPYWSQIAHQSERSMPLFYVEQSTSCTHFPLSSEQQRLFHQK